MKSSFLPQDGAKPTNIKYLFSETIIVLFLLIKEKTVPTLKSNYFPFLCYAEQRMLLMLLSSLLLLNEKGKHYFFVQKELNA